ncbi:Metal-dependent hydrolases of the beta-lactamase superfamily I [Lunatimonas lonarensis]|uniref:Metal-dependent hydrolases of the beta-lactamase superfamily I n=1 Tax=Lunatimonas lonarensis TaxID=1232681 RepID=R7ZPQ2_9BACT|nr:MBL fold metallo-hydrolase [Lunatimonas lonarensis]EON76067.1 Metal-dependent hydrolases of the beta-lactamase superfamily I [Lunatimonas lonarensis]
MKVTFLGTGTSQGVPVIGCACGVCRSLDFRDKRLRTSVHIEVGGKSFVIDTGPDFRAQMLREGVERLDAVIYTHEHKDHTAGMDDIRPFNYKQGADIPIYGTQKVIDQLKAEFSYVFASKKYPGVPGVKVHEITDQPFEIQGVKFTPIEVMHHKIPVFGYRIRDFVYITDANRIDSSQIDKIRGCGVLVLNALQIQPHISHFTLDEALEMVELINPVKTYFTHISHRLGTVREVEKRLPNAVSLAYDGLQINL